MNSHEATDPPPAGSPRASRSSRKATLVEREDLSPTLAIFRFEPEGNVPSFEPGQFLPLGVELASGPPLWRPYSIASPPEEQRYFELYVRLVEDPPDRPHLTHELWSLPLGSRVLWKAPRGKFTVAGTHPDGSADDRRLLLIGGGTGLAPFVSLVLHMELVGARRPIVLCHGASHAHELGYRERLAELARAAAAREQDPWSFHYLTTISRPSDARNVGWTGHVGRVESLLAREAGAPSAVERALGESLDPREACAYVCGFEGTITGVLEVLAPLGFRGSRDPHADGSFDVHSESYG